MKFGYTIIYVKNIAETVAFYQKAFSLEVRFVIEDQYAEMETGECTLAFASDSFIHNNEIQFRSNREDKPSAGFEVAFVAENVQLAFDTAVLCGAVAVVPPKKKPWGQEVSYVKDCNGVLVEICSPIQR